MSFGVAEGVTFTVDFYLYRNLEEKMLRDKVVLNPDPAIQPREKFLRRTPSGRAKYPFKGMQIGDYFCVQSLEEATLIRSALQSFYRRVPGRRFMVRQRVPGEWVCRRIS